MDPSENNRNSVKTAKKKKKHKVKLTKKDIGVPTNFEYIHGSNVQVHELLRLAGVTKKHLKNEEGRAIIDHFIEMIDVRALDTDISATKLSPIVEKKSNKQLVKRPNQPPPPPPSINVTKINMQSDSVSGPPPPPLPPALLTMPIPSTGLVEKRPHKELPSVKTGIDALLDEIKSGLKLKAVSPNQRVKVVRKNSNILAGALRNALKKINDASRDSSSSSGSDVDWEDD